jgi:hypothetical protein
MVNSDSSGVRHGLDAVVPKVASVDRVDDRCLIYWEVWRDEVGFMHTKMKVLTDHVVTDERSITYMATAKSLDDNKVSSAPIESQKIANDDTNSRRWPALVSLPGRMCCV